MEPERIFSALADLAPAAGERILDVTRAGEPVHWLPDPQQAPASAGTNRLAAIDALHRDERTLRRGCAFVLGGPAQRPVVVPLLTQPVRLARDGSGYRVVAAGDLELTPMIADRALAATLESVPGLGTATWLASAEAEDWIRTAAAAAGPGWSRRRSPPCTACAPSRHSPLWIMRCGRRCRSTPPSASWSAAPGSSR